MYKKLENFWYYHRIKVFAVIFLIITAVAIIILTGGDIKPDIEIAYVTVGRDISQETEVYLNQCFASGINDVTGDNIKKAAFIPLQDMQVDMQFVSEGAQIVLMDRGNLNRFMRRDVFEAVDDFIIKYKIDLSGNPEVKANIDGKEVHTYAIPVKFMPILLNAGFPSDNYYLTIRKYGSPEAKKENAYKVAEVFLEFKQP